MQPLCEMSDEELDEKRAKKAETEAQSAWEAVQKKRAKRKVSKSKPVSKAKRVSKRGRS